MKETLADIAYAINKHTITEHQNMPCQGGVARYRVNLEEMPSIHQVYLANVKVRKQVYYGDDSVNIWKNTKLGGALIMKGIGDSIYYGNRPQPYKMKVYNAATYRHWTTGSIDQVEIQLEDKKRYRFANLKSLLMQFQDAKSQAAENAERLRKLQLEREEIERQQKKAAEEEAMRLEKEREENERRTRECQEKAERFEQEIAEQNAKIKYIKSFVRNELALRIQHILDPSQEEAKRSHVYDGIPVLIDVSKCRLANGEEDWDAETPLVREVVGPELNAVYSSEPSYGPYFNRAYPEAEHRIVDWKRIKYPISGTQIRDMDNLKEREKWII